MRERLRIVPWTSRAGGVQISRVRTLVQLHRWPARSGWASSVADDVPVRVDPGRADRRHRHRPGAVDRGAGRRPPDRERRPRHDRHRRSVRTVARPVRLTWRRTSGTSTPATSWRSPTTKGWAHPAATPTSWVRARAAACSTQPRRPVSSPAPTPATSWRSGVTPRAATPRCGRRNWQNGGRPSSNSSAPSPLASPPT